MGLFPKPTIRDAIVLVWGFIAVLIFLGGSTKARRGVLQFLSFEIQIEYPQLFMPELCGCNFARR